MPDSTWLQGTNPAFRLMIATSWLSPPTWQERQEENIRGAIGDGLDWMEYLRLVDRHRIPALSWAALGRVPGLEIPGFAKQELKKRSDACRMQALNHAMLLAGVLKSLNRAAIPVMPFKGPTLSSGLYGDVGLRQSRDLDLAVSEGDVFRAQACLIEMGWRPESNWFPLSPRQQESLLGHEHHLVFFHSQGAGMLELHWRNTWDPPGTESYCWSDSNTSGWQGCIYQSMNPVIQALYLCRHGAEHAWARAKWLGDFARIHAEGRLDWEAVLSEARRTGQERALLASLRLLDLLYGLPLPSLSGDPWKELPALLIDAPLKTLRAPEQPLPTVSMASILRLLRKSRYEKLLLPRGGWRNSWVQVWYRREDFRLFHIPDRFFWAYAPLRPVSWLWRWARRGMALWD